MTPRLLAQLGHVFLNEADKLAGDPYAYPRRDPSPGAIEEAERLATVAYDLFTLASDAGANTGTDAAFGGP